MALDSFYDPNVHLAALNAGLMQYQTFDNSLVENEQLQAFSLLTNSRIASFSVDQNAQCTNPTIASNAMESPLGATRFTYSNGLSMNSGFTANMSPNLNYVEQSLLPSSLQTSTLPPNRPQVARKKQQLKGSISRRHDSLSNEMIQDPVHVAQRLKKPRLDMSEEAMLGHSVSQLGQPFMQSQSTTHKHQIPGLVQQYMLQNRNQLEAAQSGLQNQPMSYQMQQRATPGVNDAPLFNGSVCARRVMQYVYHLRHRPADNNIAYWRKFVTEYFAPGAKKRWCVSLYDKVGLEAKSVIRKSAMSVWQCDMCGCGAGRGFEVVFDSLPRLTKLVYESGVIDELLFLDLPQSYRLPSGLVMLKYEKVSQESVYENFRVVHEGQLCIIFTRDLKILSWEFCVRRHEVFVSRSSVMSQIAQAEQKYQNVIDDCRSNGVLLQDSQAIRNRFQTVGGWIANALDFGLVDDLGFSKRFARCLQIAQIVQSMKDVMTFSQASQMGPIESLKHLYSELGTSKLQKLEPGKRYSETQDLSASNLIPSSPVISTSANNLSNMVKERFITSSEEATSALLSHSNKVAFNGPRASSSRATANFAENGLSSSSRQEQSKERRAIQKILQEMINNNGIANDSTRQVVTSTSTRVYDTREAAKVQGDLLWRSSNLWANHNMDLSESAASQSSSMDDRI